ncbi:DNRLRE domain-containing protein [Vibrio coralliilyticus]|uniref:CBM96 family carbohydrate-binding protein n=1 Tax=Vibrio coralliilyticus TaxID=190893 RepID=UPI00148C2EB5|nr:DNRLRE domain-containing protein [Vibrio coralliilyticus]NOH54281.1 DNRLRE domain-containing protein [Vibrio coralliilyticus]
MRFNNKLLFVYLLPLVLSGCEGETSEQNEHSSHQEAVSSPVATDNYSQFLLDESQHVVSLAEHVSDPQGLPLTLERVEPLSQSCGMPIVDKHHLSFTVAESIPETCVYRYVVRNHPENPQLDKESSAESVVLLSTETDSSLIPPISKSIKVDSELTIALRQELGSTYPDGYTLNQDVVVLGDGVATADVSSDTILYQASSTPGDIRLIYSLSSDDGNNVKAGYIDLAASSEGNSMPIAENIAGPESLYPNTIITIDVSDSISDPDGDSLQLTDVYAYNANVAITDPLDVNNTKFNFSASQPGSYSVTYYVSDHRGGYAVAVARVVVSDPPLPWNDIVLASGARYTAPWEKSSADIAGIYYQGTEPEVINGTEYLIPLFSADAAQSLCQSRGMALPSQEQMNALFQARPDVANFDNWPTSVAYWSSSKSAANQQYGFNMSSGAPILLPASTPLIVTCVYPGELSTLVSKDNAYQTDLADGDYNTVEAYTKQVDGSPISGQRIYAFSDDENLKFESQSVLTDSEGKASFKVRSVLSGEFDVLVNYYSQSKSALVHFIGDLLLSISLSGEHELLLGNTEMLTAMGKYQSGTESDISQEVSWKSDNPKVIRVTNIGEIFAEGMGSAIVDSTSGEITSNKFKVTVPFGTLEAVEDATIRGGSYSNQNFGSDSSLIVKRDKTNNNYYYRKTLVKFHIGNKPVQAFSKAILRMYVIGLGSGFGDTGRDLTVYSLSSNDWSETGVTWNTAPKVLTEGNSSTIKKSDLGKWVEWDVTELINAQPNDIYLSLLLDDLGEYGHYVDVSFYSHESGTAPQLVIQP